MPVCVCVHALSHRHLSPSEIIGTQAAGPSSAWIGPEPATLVLVPSSSLCHVVRGAGRLIPQLQPLAVVISALRCLSPTAAETAWQGPGKESLRGSPPAALSVWNVLMGSTATRQVKEQPLVGMQGSLHCGALGSAKSLKGLG